MVPFRQTSSRPPTNQVVEVATRSEPHMAFKITNTKGCEHLYSSDHDTPTRPGDRHSGISQEGHSLYGITRVLVEPVRLEVFRARSFALPINVGRRWKAAQGKVDGGGGMARGFRVEGHGGGVLIA